MADDVMRSLRLPAALVARAEAVAKKLQRKPDLAAVGSVTVSSVLRQAIVRGLEQLEVDAGERRLPATVDELIQTIESMGVKGRSDEDIDRAHQEELDSWGDR